MHNPNDVERQSEEDRRSFLKSCGRFAATVPPAMTLMLSTSMTSKAIARSTAHGDSGGGGGRSGGGRGRTGGGHGSYGGGRENAGGVRRKSGGGQGNFGGVQGRSGSEHAGGKPKRPT